MLMLHMHMGIIMFIIVAANFIARDSFPLRIKESYHVTMNLSTLFGRIHVFFLYLRNLPNLQKSTCNEERKKLQ